MDKFNHFSRQNDKNRDWPVIMSGQNHQIGRKLDLFIVKTDLVARSFN